MNPSVFSDTVALPKALVAPEHFCPFEWAWLDESIPACFARWVDVQPQSVAVQTPDASLTYGALASLADRLANSLLERLGHDAEPVAIVTASDLNAVVAMMGILTAGKFFVAINPTSSPREMCAILESAGARAIVTDGDGETITTTLGAVDCADPELFRVDRLDIDGLDGAPAVPMAADTLAQIAYTSGSTGAPKGILKSHRALLHQSMTHINGYFIGPGDRMMAPAPMIFGASLGIVFSALLGGATLLPIRLKEYTAAQLRDWLCAEQVTVYHSVASFFRQFAATLGTAESFPHLRIIKLGGEAIQPEDLRLYRRSFAEYCVLRIGLASTEAGNYCWHFVGKESALEGSPVPVGRPLVGTEILLLDDDRVPVASGEIGEIAVKSAFLALGYWKNPELTRARFLPDPIEPQKTIYLTGDLGRWRDDGLLEHLGRADQMVKIRGNRVELGAVEAALVALPAIQAAAVVAVSGAGDDKRLVAYLMPTAERLTTGELSAQLRMSLPDYMRPARVVWLDRMPLLPNGKIDRAALPAPGAARPELDTSFVTPHSELERQIADIWAEVLGLDEVGVEDNFFELGGDSILAMRMVWSVEQATGVRAPPEFFRTPTVSYMARLSSGDAIAHTTAPQIAPAEPASRKQQHIKSKGLRALTRHTHAWVRTRFEDQAFRRPYFQGVQWLLRWYGLPWVQRLFYPGESRLVLRFAQSMGTPVEAVEQQVVLSLVGRAILQRWAREASHRAQPGQHQSPLVAELSGALANAPESSQWRRYLETEGAAHLSAAFDKGHGIIAVTVHTPTRFAALSYFDGISVPSLGVGNRSYKATALRLNLSGSGDNNQQAWWAPARAAVASEAYEVLRQGGVIRIAGDEQDMSHGVGAVIGDRLHRLSPGFAELAVATNAAVLPIYSALLIDGRIRLTFAPPLTWDQRASHSEQVTAIVQAYGRVQTALWRSKPSVVSKEIMAQHLALPQMRNETGV